MDASPVVKFGGSLFDLAGDIIHDIISSGIPMVIVPGGGPFIEMTERCGIREEESHWMAVAGMEQYGWYLSSFGIPVMDGFGPQECQSVFLPYKLMREEDPLPHVWAASSDTIAAWLAWRLGKNLILLKSVDGISVDGRVRDTITAPVSAPEVDPLLIPFVLSHNVRTHIINGRKRERLISHLHGRKVPCTVIGTTL